MAKAVSGNLSAVFYLDPYSPPGAPALPYTPRLRPIAKAPVLGLFSNMFTDASAFLRDLRDPLSRLLPGVEFREYDKGSRRNSSFPMDPAQLARIKAECDAVIAAFGHCGSCTAGVMRDSVSIASNGLPVVALVTEKFFDEARFVARAGGIPDVPLLILPHPVAGRDAKFQRALADAIAPGILTALTAGQTVINSRILEPEPIARAS